ncbi:S-layer homology domain-containing protein [Neobacillus mesonae]|nr:S-layer homology domain-containing protein [Neobacillus mesonae]
MSNTGNPYTSNHKKINHVMNSRGGEKKVMKKILSVALSTAMAFSMFASVAFGQSGLTDVNAQYEYLKDKGIFTGYTDGQAHLDRQMTRAEFATVIAKTLGLKPVTGVYSFKDKNYGANHWAAPYVEAVYAAGIMEGVNSTKKLFGTSNPVTVQEMATVLVRALDLEVPTETNNSATQWAKGYVQAAINAGLVSANANFQANADRALLVGAAYAVDQELSLSVESYTVSEAGKVVEFKMTDGETVKVTLDKALVANTETEVKFTYQDKEFTEKVTYVVTSATKVQSVTATNLKEVLVTLDGDVNKASAENVATYTLKDEAGNTQTVKSAALQDGGKSVILTLTNSLENQEIYKLSVNSLKGSDTTKLVTQKDIEFKPVDSALPEVVSVSGLGNKAVKITFSEPVVSTSTVADTFKLDGNAISGVISGSGTRELIVEVFNTMSVGNHTLTINDRVSDYVPYKLIETTKDFTVVEDTTAPTVAEVKDVTLEGATVVFSEEVKDNEAIKGGNYYWVSGSTKHYANSTVERIDSKTFKLTFSGSDKLPAVVTDLYVQNIVDYSGNVIAADTKVSINPVVDQTRPEVVSAIFDDTSYDRVKFTFTKPVDLSTFKTTNVVLKDKDGKVVTDYGVSILGGASGATKEFTLVFSEAIDAGNYTLELSGLQDTTTLRNTMLPHTVTLEAKDAAAPGVLSVTGSGNVYYVTYDKAMDTTTTASILDADNYFVKYVRTTSSTPVTGKLPAGTNITPVNGNKGVIITLPNNVVTVNEITIQGVKSEAGIYLNNYSVTYGTESNPIVSNFQVTRANATAKDTVSVKFNQPVSTVNKDGFSISTGLTVTNAVVDSNDNTVVKLTLSGKLPANPTASLNFTASAAKNLVNDSLTGTSATILDTIAPSVAKTDAGKINLGTDISFDSTARTLTINFDEAIKAKNTANFGGNFTVYKADGSTIGYGSASENYEVKNVDALTSANGADEIVLDFSDVSYVGGINVVFKNDNGNFVDASAVGTDGKAKNDLKVEAFDTRDSDTVSGSVAIVRTPSDVIAASAITVTNNYNSNDTVGVTGLAAGDVVKVYNTASKAQVLGTATVAEGQTAATVTINQLGTGAGSVYVTVTKPGKAESAVTEKAYLAEVVKTAAPAASAITVTNVTGGADTVAVSGLEAGDTVNVYTSSTGTTVAGTEIVAEGETVATVSLELNEAGGDIWVTVTKADQSESDRTIKAYGVAVAE